jgi:hypothetical protein
MELNAFQKYQDGSVMVRLRDIVTGREVTLTARADGSTGLIDTLEQKIVTNDPNNVEQRPLHLFAHRR